MTIYRPLLNDTRPTWFNIKYNNSSTFPHCLHWTCDVALTKMYCILYNYADHKIHDLFLTQHFFTPVFNYMKKSYHKKTNSHPHPQKTQPVGELPIWQMCTFEQCRGQEHLEEEACAENMETCTTSQGETGEPNTQPFFLRHTAILLQSI